jgi:DNA polymerase
VRFIVIDLESYFDDEYTFNKLNTEQYVRHEKFELHGAAIKEHADQPAYWLAEPELRAWLKQQDWSDIFLVSHHAQWDHFALSHHYDVHPKMSGCSLSMSRLLLGNHLSVSLDAVRKHFNMSLKTTPYGLFKGLHWNQMTPQVQQLVAEGACDEVESIWKIFGILYQQFPAEELEVVDTIVKMFSEPALVGDIDMLGKIWTDEDKKKKANLAALNVSESDLQSADRFAQLLRNEGIEPETKQGKKKQIYCFAKTDQFMRDLLESEDDRIRTLAEARLGVKSTIMQTRAETLGWMARRGPLCVYLSYSGAGTLRPSGGDGSNFLNLKRRSPIRPALMAPKGYLLGPVDSSQVECRVCHYLAGGPDEPVIKLFRAGKDPYVGLASLFYEEEIYKPKDDDPRRYEMEMKRGMGKQGRLMCQYGAAGKQFRATAKNGLYGPSVDIPIDDAIKFVSMYRTTTPSVCAPRVGYWSICNFQMLPALANGDTREFGPLTIKDHRIYLPNGAMMIYDTLEWHIPDADEECRDFERDGFWRLKTRQGWKKMWGAKLTQNICEAVSRVIVSQAMLRIKRMGFRTLNWPYDELCLLIPDDNRAQENLQLCMNEMKRTPDWLPGLPLDCEGSLGERYSK